MRRLSVAVAGLLVAGFVRVDAQVNIQSAGIQFRNNTSGDQAQKTNHYGEFDAYARTRYNAVSGFNYYPTASGIFGPYGVYGLATSAGSNFGTGGRFEGGNIGVLGNAGLSGGGALTIHYGGFFSASGAAGANIAVFGIAGGSGTNIAGYFVGPTYCTSGQWSGSDATLKTSAAPLRSTISQIMLLKPKTYYFDTTAHPKMALPKRKQYGLLAQDVETVFPEMVMDVPEPPDSSASVRESPRTFKAVNYTQLIAVLVAGMQEQQKEIEELKAQLGAK